MTYPISCVITELWKECCPPLQEKKPDPMHIEMCSVAERAFNYMHTGNVAVIATTVMNPLWIGQAIIVDGMPSFNPQMVQINGRGLIQVDKNLWPYDRAIQQPRTSSKTSQTYVYNNTVAKVSIKPIHITPCSTSTMLDGKYSRGSCCHEGRPKMALY
jgi:hypothetical protein